MRFKVISKTEDKGAAYNIDTKQYEEFLQYNVVLERRPGNDEDGRPTSLAGRIELKYLSRINAAKFVVGDDVHVDFSPAASKPGELADLPPDVHPKKEEAKKDDKKTPAMAGAK